MIKKLIEFGDLVINVFKAKKTPKKKKKPIKTKKSNAPQGAKVAKVKSGTAKTNKKGM